MPARPIEAETGPSAAISVSQCTLRLGLLRDKPIEGLVLTLALTAVPVSIAATETFLAVALVFRLWHCFGGEARIVLPRVFWFWLALAATEISAWLCSPSLKDGWGEIRHLLLVGSLFFVLPALSDAAARVTAWRAVFFSSALGSVFLIGDFMARLTYYHREIAAGDDVSFYLRTGGLLNNWMVYGTVEILVVAGLLSFWFAYPEQRRRWWPVLALNAVAVVLSLTRTVWVSSFLLLAILLWRRRSRWLWVLPLLPLGIYVLAPGAVRSRLNVSTHLDYFSNAERLQMIRVGWVMIREHPWAGVGPGRIGKLYRSYLQPADPVPAYHGHLHNNLVQMAAQFGAPVTLVAIVFTVFLFSDLATACREAESEDKRFLCEAAMLSLIGFLVAGCFDYTYGHSLALILLSFAVLSPLSSASRMAVVREGKARA